MAGLGNIYVCEALYRAGDTEHAAGQAKLALERWPKSPARERVLLNGGLALAARQDWPAAAEALNQSNEELAKALDRAQELAEIAEQQRQLEQRMARKAVQPSPSTHHLLQRAQAPLEKITLTCPLSSSRLRKTAPFAVSGC